MGMHTADELVDAGAEFVALWPQEIGSHLLGDVAARPPSGACAVPSSRTTPAAMPTPRTTPAAVPSQAGRAGPAGTTTASGLTRSDDHAGAAGEARRDRRRAAAGRWQDPTPAAEAREDGAGRPDRGEYERSSAGASTATGPPDELLAAVRLICDRP